MKNLFLTLLFCVALTALNAQKWNYSSGESSFDGKYKTSSIVGIGDEFPYETPILVVNYFEKSRSLNIYIKNCGYSGCDGNKVQMKFNGDETVYSFNVSTNAENDTWFLSGNKIDLLEQMKKYAVLHVRITSDCLKSDLMFSLSGSTVAINYVMKDFMEGKMRYKINLEKEKQKEMEGEKLISSNVLCRAKITSNAKVFFYCCGVNSLVEKNNTTLLSGEWVVILNDESNDKFYILKESTSINLKFDTTTHYINKWVIDLKTIEGY